MYVSWESLPEPDKYRSSFSQHVVLNGGIRERTEGAKGDFEPHKKNNNINQPHTPDIPGTKPPTNEYPWLQLNMHQRMAWLDINWRRGPPPIGKYQGEEVGVGGHPHRLNCLFTNWGGVALT